MRRQRPFYDPLPSEEEEEDLIQFGAGVGAGWQQTQAMFKGMGALVNSFLGDEEATLEYLNEAQEKLKAAEEYGGTVTTLEEIDGAADAVRWLTYTAGTVLPSIATSIAGGGIGGAVVQGVAKKRIADRVKKEVNDVVQDKATQAVKNTLVKNRLAASTASARKFGQRAGAFGTSASLEGGNAFLNIYNETGIEAPDVAALTGVASGALDAIVPFVTLQKVLPSKVFGDVKDEIVERAAKNNGLLKRAMVGGAQSAGVEGLTEAMQEFFQATAVGMIRENPQAPLLQGYGQAMIDVLSDWKNDPDSVYRSQFLNAFAAGMVGGGIVGGVSGTLGKDGPEQVEDITKDKPPEDTPKTPKDKDSPFDDPAVAPSEPQTVVKGDFGSEIKAPDEPQSRIVRPMGWSGPEKKEELELRQSERILAGRKAARALIPDEIYEGKQLDPEANRVAGVEADKQLAIIQKEPPVNVLPTGETIELGGPVAYRLKELIGKTVNYQGVEGILQQRDDGVFIVTTPEADIPVESGESSSAYPADKVGVSPVDVEVDRPDPEVKYNPEDQTFEVTRETGKKNQFKYIKTEYNEEGKAVTVKAETMNGQPRNFVSQKIVKGLEDAIGQTQLQALPNQVMVSITDLPPAIQGTILDTREENNQDISEDTVTLEEVQQAVSQADPEVQQSLTERTEGLFNRQTLEEMPLATFTMKEEWREFQGKTVSAADATLEERQELLNDLAGQDVKQPNGEDIINLPDQGMEAVAERIGQAMRRPIAMSNEVGEVTSYDALNTFMNEGDQGQTILDEIQHAYFDLVESGMPIQLFDYLKSLSRHDASQKGLLHKSSGAAVKGGLSLDNALLTDTKTEKGRRALRWVLGHESWHVLDKNLDISVNLPSFALEVIPDAEGISIRAGDVIAELYTNYSNDTDLGKVFAYPFNLLSEKTENVNTDLEAAARTVQKEVFAELGALYLSNPRLLKLQAPNAYEVIRTVRDNPELQIGEVTDARDQASPAEVGAEGVGVQGEVQTRPVGRGSEVQDGGRVGDDGGRSVETEQADRGLGVEATTTDRDSDGRLVQEQKLAYGVYRIPFNEEGKRDLKSKRLIGEFDSLEEANAYSEREAIDNGTTDMFGMIVDVIKLREKKTPDTQSAETQTPAAKIEDFGEKLGGAIKDQYARFKDALANEEIDAEAVPLSKSFPAPPYQKLAEAGADKQVLVATAMIRGLIGTKPKLRNKLRVWAQDVNRAKDLVRRMTDGEITPEQALAEINLFTTIRSDEGGMLLALPISSEADPSRLAEAAEYRIDSYMGMFTRPDRTKISSEDTKDGRLYEVYKKRGRSYRMGDSFETVEEAQEHLRSIISNLDDKKKTTSTRQSKIELFQDRKTKKKFLGWQGSYDVIRIKEFDDSSEATEWLLNNREEAEAILASKKIEPEMRREKNLPRTGKGRRDSDKDITPEVFAEAFGFRGVEFGNWVEGGKRQQDLNQAFDALTDLADVLKIPTRALSLNGELGLAFGSRGRGGKRPAKAHYEPDNIVINLTKKSGAGSLAHEWWHGVDNYFSRMRGEKSKYVTDSPRPLRVRRDGMFLDDDSVRPELLEKFAGVMEVINKSDLRKRSLEQDKKRSKKYWSKPIEMSARSFESFIIRQLELKDITNDYLANISNYTGNADYPYPTPEEAEAIDQAFMGVVEELKTKETDEGKIALFKREGKEIKTVKVGKPSSKVRPEIARAYKDLQARNITREKFDEIVLETIKPYLDLPTPATTEQLNTALDKRQVVRINLPVPNGLQVGLRLDINAYDHHGVWAVAIHGPNGTEYKSPRYRGFASIKDANLLLDKKAQEKSQKVMEGSNKKPFAQMEGTFINRTEQETLQIGQTALESSLSGKPDKDGNMWRQIGFDPRRHASFYDRSTGEFISTADEIIQIGPLVLGKNATTVDSSEVLYARTPSNQTKSHEDAAADGTLMNGQPSNNELTLDDESRSEMFLRKIQDKYLVLKKSQDKVADYLGMTELPDWMNAYQGETLHSGKIKKDFDELEVEYAQPIGEIIRSNQLDLDDVGLYLMARHAPERNRRIAATNASRIEELINKEAKSRQNGEQEKAEKIKEQIEWLSNAASGLSNDQAAEILDASRKDGTANAKEDIAKLVYKMLEQNRQRMQASGLVDEETIDGWNEAYQFYVPLKGFAASEDSDGNLNPPNILPKGFNISGSEVFRALGRKSQSANPVLFALSDVENKIVRAQRNEVSQRFLAMARAVSEKGSDQFRVYEAGDMPIGRKASATGQLETGRMNVAEVRAATRLDTGDPRFLSVKEDGQEKFIEIKHAGLNRAMHNVGSENYDALVGLIGKGTDFLQWFQNMRRNMLINWNPSWMLINPLRDLQTGLMFNLAQESKDGGMTEGENLTGEILSRYLPAGQAYYKNMRGEEAGNEYDGYYEEYTKTGAPTGMTLTRDIEEQQARLQALVTDGPLKAKGKKALQFIEELNQTSENVIRFATYVSARESGIRAEKAAVLAKDLTVNFNRKGELSSGLNLLYLFFNAAVQGTANLATALSGKTADGKFTKAQIGAASISLLAYLVTQHNLMASAEDEDGESVYNDLNDYDHLMSWNVVLGDGKTFGQLPLPYGYGLFHTLGRLGAEYANDAKDEGDVVAEIAAASAHHILPPPLGFLGSVGQVDDMVEFMQRGASGLAPTIAEPILELGFNQNYFGAPIYIEDNPLMPPTPDSSRAKRSTLDMYKFTAKWFNENTGGSQYREGFVDMSPDSMQYLVGYTFGGLGRFVSRSSDLSAKMNTDSDTRDDITMSDWPIVRYFHGEPSEYTDKIEYYDNIKDAQEIFIENKETGGGDDAFKRKFGKIVPLETLYKDTQKQLRKLRKSKKLIEREQTDSVKAYDQISKIEDQMQSLFDRFNKAYREANK